MARLIINADDFGLTPGINRAVSGLASKHALTSATLMACGSAFEDAVHTARITPSLGVGCHIVLLDGRPMAQQHEVASLLQQTDPHPLLHRSLPRFAARVQGKKIDASHIRTEATAQIRALQAAGIQVTHVDTHKHTHMFPLVAAAVLNAVVDCGIRAIRNPFEPAWCSKLGGGVVRRTEVSLLRRQFQNTFLNQPLIQSGTVRTTDGSLGVTLTGTLNRESLQKIIDHIPNGTWELVTHPGYNDDDLSKANTRLRESRDTEREALLEVIERSPHKLITFSEI